MTEELKHVTVRLRVPPEMRDKIEESARLHNRSMNADMVFRLEQTFAPPAPPQAGERLTFDEWLERVGPLLAQMAAGVKPVAKGGTLLTCDNQSDEISER